jgi:hypothetical protein
MRANITRKQMKSPLSQLFAVTCGNKGIHNGYICPATSIQVKKLVKSKLLDLESPKRIRDKKHHPIYKARST